jgi:large subunit ribosomal protein L27
MAHKKAQGSVKSGRDSISKRLGVKKFGSEFVRAGNVILRQRGTKFHPGKNVLRAGDDTLVSMIEGQVEFKKRKIRAFTGNLHKRTFVSVVPLQKTTENQIESINQ